MKTLYLLLLFITGQVMAQDRQMLHGRVVSGNMGVSEVYVINKTAGNEVKTNNGGYFSIPAQPGDALIVYSTKIIVREFRLNEDSFAVSPYVITVNYQAYELDEVVINASSINAESLGLVPKGQKRLTPAEKRLKTAGDFKPVHIIGIIGGGMAIDPIINAINGRTKMLKKALETERKEQIRDKVNNLFEEEEIIDSFHIPEEYVKGFVFYAVEDKEFAEALKANNKERATFLMTGLAKKYLKLISVEK